MAPPPDASTHRMGGALGEILKTKKELKSGCRIMVIPQPSKLKPRVRFPSSAST